MHLNPEKARNQLFTQLDLILTVSEKKLSMETKRDETRLKWGRLMVNAISCYGKLLETHELDLRITALEEQLKEGVLIPHDAEQRTKN